MVFLLNLIYQKIPFNMKRLTTLEKLTFSDSINEIVEIINNKTNSQFPAISLKTISYGINLKNEYIYYDYPYKPNDTEKVNSFIIEHYEFLEKELYTSFFKAKSKGKFGFIAFDYHYDQINNKLYLLETVHNLDNEISVSVIEGCFVISFYNLYNQFAINKCLSKDTNELKNIKRETIVFLSRINEIYNINYTLNSVFTSTYPTKIISEEIVKYLYKECYLLLENYIQSPILEILLLEQRKSRVLAYQHTIANLRLVNQLTNLEVAISKQDNKNIENKFAELSIRMRLLRMIHYSIFQVEYLDAGYPDINNTGLYDLANKTVTEILIYFDETVNIKGVRLNLEITKEAKEKDFVPEIGIPENLAFELYDCQLLLWNLWVNACNKALLNEQKTIDVQISAINNYLVLDIQNHGVMPKEYIQFLNGEVFDYPEHLDPNRPYRGLQIIRDICDKYNKILTIKAGITDSVEPKTKIQLTFKV